MIQIEDIFDLEVRIFGDAIREHKERARRELNQFYNLAEQAKKQGIDVSKHYKRIDRLTLSYPELIK